MSNMVRRVFDVLVAVGLLTATLPVFVPLAVINRLGTGRWFFRQTRIGRALRPFVLLKFQTMVPGGGSTVTVAGDRRITRYGRLLRALKLDELPQLINIVRGEMTLVGPRPLTPNEVAAIPSEMVASIYSARPGMTGISALVFADEERLLAGMGDPERAYFDLLLPRKAALEVAYVRQRTWATDLVILTLTPLAPFVRGLGRRLVLHLVPAAQGWNPDSKMARPPSVSESS